MQGCLCPLFWLGMVIILFLVSYFGMDSFHDLRLAGSKILKPISCNSLSRSPVGYRSSALIMRITRSSMLDVLREDYIRTAWAKGQREWIVVFGHALSNATLPVITVIGIEFAFMIGGWWSQRRSSTFPAWPVISSTQFSGAIIPWFKTWSCSWRSSCSSPI